MEYKKNVIVSNLPYKINVVAINNHYKRNLVSVKYRRYRLKIDSLYNER